MISCELASAAAQQAAGAPAKVDVWPGVEVLVKEHPDWLRGKRVGILTNPTGVDRELHSTIDLVRALPGVTVVRLFSPEHGLRGGYAAGEAVNESRDPVSGLPIVSLFGDTRRPPPESLRGLDVVLYDIQDVGHRTYTFVSTLTYMMEACEKAGVEVWVLDRPDPLGGDKVGGPMIDAGNLSFVGVHNVPQVYGLTPGEFAKLIQIERTPKVKLRVVEMKNWKRGMVYGDLGWPWVPPSPHIPHWEDAFFYAMTGTLGELGKVSEGVGTPQPFELVGAPWMNGPALARALDALKLPGVRFRATTFTPRYGKWTGQECQGAQIHLTDPHACNPAAVSDAILKTLASLYPGRKLYEEDGGADGAEDYSMFKKSLGANDFLAALAGRGPWDAALRHENDGLLAYLKRRAKALIYPDARNKD